MKYIHIFFCFMLINSCSFNQVAPVFESCDSPNSLYIIPSTHYQPQLFPECPNQDFPTIIQTEKYAYFNSCTNPVNPNQMLYLRYNTERYASKLADLCVFDICTGIEKVLLSDIIHDGLSWGKMGWILFKKGDQNIWKIKPNGDSLIQMTYTGTYNNYANWNEDGEKWAYQKEMEGQYLSLIADIDGKTIDTLSNILFRKISTWDYGKQKIVYIGRDENMNSGIYVYDVKTQTPKEIFCFEYPTDFHAAQAVWLVPDSIILWKTQYYIYTTNITTKQTKTIKKMGDNVNYFHLDASNSVQKIIATRCDKKMINPCLQEISQTLFFMDLDGKNENRIKIPN